MCYVLDINDKRLLSSVYNEVNKEIYGYGVVELKVEQKDNIIIFNVKNQRVKILVTLEENYEFLKKIVDQALFEEFKIRLRTKLESEFSFEIVSVLRDYDPVQQKAYTLLIIK